MATITESSLLKMERTRAKLEQKLRDRGVYVEDGEDLNSLIDKLDKIGSNSDNFTALLEDSMVAIDDDRPTILKAGMFYNCPHLKSIKLNSVTKTVGSGSPISNNPILEEIELNNLQIVNVGVTFSNNKKVKNISMRNLKHINSDNTFSYLGRDVLDRFKIVLPKLNSTGFVAPLFNYIGATILSLPRFTSLGDNRNFASYCPNLQIVDFGYTNSIGNFSYSDKFDTLILRKETVVPLAGVERFTQTCFASNGTGGKCYVPQSLINDYKVATNWSSINVTFLPIEGTIYEDLDWADKEEFMITVDGKEYYLPIDTTVAQFKATFLINNLYSNDVELTDDVLLSGYKDMQLSSTVGNEVTE